MLAQKAEIQDTCGAIDIIIDPETGEVTTAEPITTDILPRVARRLIAAREDMEKKTNLIDQEVSRLLSIRDIYVSKYNKVEAYLMSRCEYLMRESGQAKLEYPGIGKFRFGLTRESINDEAYAAMDDDQRSAIHKQWPGCFRLVSKVNPDKTAIKAILKTGQNVPGFDINEPEEKFEFKEESC